MLKLGISFMVGVSALAAVVACVACTDSADLGGGAGTGHDSGPDVATGSSGSSGSSGGQDGSLLGDASDPRNDDDGGACGVLTHHDGLIGPGGTLAERPVGTSVRIRFAYQGPRVAITNVSATQGNPGASFGPLEAGKNSGYWYELRNAADVTLDTRLIQDPTRLETSDGDGGFANFTIPVCNEKTFEVQSSNDEAAKFVVIFGSPYGTQNAAGELARFVIP